MTDMPFIKTSDEGIIKLLRQEGYPELEKEGGLHVFVNIGRYKDGNFSKVPIEKCAFSQTLCL